MSRESRKSGEGFRFPDPRRAGPDGLVAITPHMTPELVLEAYRQGIFPWSTAPVRWFSPDPRAVFVPGHVRLPSRLGRYVRRDRFEVRFDTAFRQVISSCREAHADAGEWISEEFVDTYTTLHEQGHAHCVEVWQDGTLVGGLYGLQLGGLFAGESMFHRVANASKVAFTAFMQVAEATGIVLVDAQVLNENTARLGAVLMRRRDYLKVLPTAMAAPAHLAGAKWPATMPTHIR